MPDNEDPSHPNTIPIPPTNSNKSIYVDIGAYPSDGASYYSKWDLWINGKAISIESFYKNDTDCFFNVHKGVELHDGDVIEYESIDQQWDQAGGYQILEYSIEQNSFDYADFSVVKKN